MAADALVTCVARSINIHGIDTAVYNSPCLLCGRVSITCETYWWDIIETEKYILLFLKSNPVCNWLIQEPLWSAIQALCGH